MCLRARVFYVLQSIRQSLSGDTTVQYYLTRLEAVKHRLKNNTVKHRDFIQIDYEPDFPQKSKLVHTSQNK